MKPRVLILGYTLAGLVTAWRLAESGYQVTILKTPDQPHKLISVQHEEETFGYDSSAPLISYDSLTYTQSLIQDLGILPQESRWKQIPLEFKTRLSTSARLSVPSLPAPWHILWGLSTFSGLPFRQRCRLLNFIEKVWEGATTLPSVLDLQTAESWLSSLGQIHSTQVEIWDPLCKFLLGTSLANTRAGRFAIMLTRVFFQSRNHSPQISQVPQLPMRLEQSLTTQLTKHAATIEDIPAIEHLQLGAEQVTGVCTSHGTLYTADTYVAAVNPTTLSSFLPERLLARFSSFNQMSQTSFVPKVTVNILSPNTINTPKLVLQSGNFSWVVCHPIHSFKKPASLFSCVSTGDTNFLSETDESIQTDAMETVQDLFPHPTPLTQANTPHCHITRQPLGFEPHLPGAESARPSNQTPIKNFLLAGSWTDTEASTEMESAISSGELCAQSVIKERGKRN